MEDGMSPDNAKREVEMDWVRLGKNRFHNLVWQVRRDKVDQYMDWHREEERWINPTMGVRCRELGIYHDDHGIEHVLPDLFRREVSYLTQDGMEEEKARYEVEKHKCRIGTNTRNDISWQFHEGYAPVLNKRMEFLTPSLLVAAVRNFHHYSDPQDGDRWIDSLREKARQKRYGQIRHILENVSMTQGEFFGREKISEAIESIYAQEVEKRRANGMSWAAATREVEENIAVYGYNFKGGLSWQFDVSVLPSILEKLDEMEEGRKSWCSASRTMLKARKIADSQDIVNLALAYLYNKEIDDRVSNGMVRADAVKDVEGNLIRLGFPRGSGVPAWEYKESFEPQMLAFLGGSREWMEKAREIEDRAAREALPQGMHMSSAIGAPEILRKKWQARIPQQNQAALPEGEKDKASENTVKPCWVLRTGSDDAILRGTNGHVPTR